MAESPRKQKEKEKDKEDTQDKTRQDDKDNEKDSEDKDEKDKESVKKNKDAPAILSAPKNKTIEKIDSEEEEKDKEKEKKKEDEKEKKKEKEKDKETDREKEKEKEKDKDENKSEPTKKKKVKAPDSVRPDTDTAQTPKKDNKKTIVSDVKGEEEKEHNAGTERKKKDKTGKNDKKRKEKKKASNKVPSSHREKEDLSKERDPPKLKYKFVTPKDEVDLASLQLEPPLSTNCKRMEEYKIAIEQIHTLLLLLMRRGNGTNGVDNIKSEKGGTAPEKLLKSVMLASVFWSSASEFQPALYDSIKTNTLQIASAERNLQEKGPKHMKRIKKFVYRQYPTYMELKKDLLKLNKTRPDSIHQKEDLLRKFTEFVKEKYSEAKSSHVAELQSALVEIMLYHRATEKNWYNIAERKSCKSGFAAESFDFSQFFKKGE